MENSFEKIVAIVVLLNAIAFLIKFILKSKGFTVSWLYNHHHDYFNIWKLIGKTKKFSEAVLYFIIGTVYTILMIVFIYAAFSEISNNPRVNSKHQFEKAETVTDNYELIDTAEQYDFDTLIKNGYHLKYKAYKDKSSNELLQSLTLMKGNQEIKMLNETSYPMLHKNLGYIGADYENAFVFAQSFGAGNPTTFQLINKETGNAKLTGTFIDTEEQEQVLLYIRNENEDNEQLIVFDLLNDKEIIVDSFSESECVKNSPGGLRNCVEIDTVTSSEIVLKVENPYEKIIKKYNR